MKCWKTGWRNPLPQLETCLQVSFECQIKRFIVGWCEPTRCTFYASIRLKFHHNGRKQEKILFLARLKWQSFWPGMPRQDSGLAEESNPEVLDIFRCFASLLPSLHSSYSFYFLFFPHQFCMRNVASFPGFSGENIQINLRSLQFLDDISCLHRMESTMADK